MVGRQLVARTGVQTFGVVLARESFEQESFADGGLEVCRAA
jgi:hypothetical protein